LWIKLKREYPKLKNEKIKKIETTMKKKAKLHDLISKD